MPSFIIDHCKFEPLILVSPSWLWSIKGWRMVKIHSSWGEGELLLLLLLLLMIVLLLFLCWVYFTLKSKHPRGHEGSALGLRMFSLHHWGYWLLRNDQQYTCAREDVRTKARYDVLSLWVVNEIIRSVILASLWARLLPAILNIYNWNKQPDTLT